MGTDSRARAVIARAYGLRPQATKRALQAHFFKELQQGPVVDSDGDVVFLEPATATPPIA